MRTVDDAQRKFPSIQMLDWSAVEDKVEAITDWLLVVNQSIVPFRLLTAMEWLESYLL